MKVQSLTLQAHDPNRLSLTFDVGLEVDCSVTLLRRQVTRRIWALEALDLDRYDTRLDWEAGFLSEFPASRVLGALEDRWGLNPLQAEIRMSEVSTCILPLVDALQTVFERHGQCCGPDFVRDSELVLAPYPFPAVDLNTLIDPVWAA